MKEKNNDLLGSASLIVQTAIAEYQRESLRIERLEQKAGFMLAFVGVIIALTVNISGNLPICIYTSIQVLFIITAICMLFILKPNKASRFPLDKFYNREMFSCKPEELGETITATYWKVMDKSDKFLENRYSLMFYGLLPLVLGLILIIVGNFIWKG